MGAGKAGKRLKGVEKVSLEWQKEK